MSTYSLTIALLMFAVYCVINVCEAGPEDPWYYEDQKKFNGDTFCDYDSTYLYKVCNRYGVMMRWKEFNRDNLSGLSCDTLPLKLWSEQLQDHVASPQPVLKCEFVFQKRGKPAILVGLSRGKGSNDVAEYHHTAEGWEPMNNYEDYLLKI